MSADAQNSGFDKSKLKKAEINFIKLIENQNLERAKKFKILRKRNLVTGSVVGAAVLGIYAYSILAVKQETFLDDFDEPATVHS